MNVLFLTLLDFQQLMKPAYIQMREFVKASRFIYNSPRKKKNEPMKLIDNGKAKY